VSRANCEEKAEAEFMANYVWKALLALYERLELERRLALRNVNSNLVIGGDAAAALKLLRAVRELSAVVRDILRRISAVVVEELEVSGSARGRVAIRLAAKRLPRALPVYRSRLELETPANLLLAATLVEVRNHLLELIWRLPAAQPWLEPLRAHAEQRLRDLLRACELLLCEPVLRPLLAKAQLLAADERHLAALEEEVELDARRRPRELRAYLRLIALRRCLRDKVNLLDEEVKELGKTLVLKITLDKLYELYGFTLLLQALVDELKPQSALVDSSGQELRLVTGHGEVSVFYNALPKQDERVESRVAKARAMGLIDGEVSRDLVKRLRGLPDTIVVTRLSEGRRRLLLLDYKYTDDYRYLSQARFKALAYLYEFDADCAVVVAPTPKKGSEEDEEAFEHKGFYDETVRYGGAYISIDSNGKILAIVYADPRRDAVESSLKALRAIINLLFSPIGSSTGE
jgi:hypothetical protein